MSKKWYQSWFNSPYYHILYHQRDDDEAEFFIDNLLGYLKPSADSKLLDIASGRGRHSVYLNKKGFDVTGIDLAYSNIKHALQFENDRLRFFVHDMRYLFYINYFDIGFNLFTSFGYFETENDHINALKAFRKSLKKGGTLVLDYFNSEKILRKLNGKEVKNIEGIDFFISKSIRDNKIIKTIEFEHKHRKFTFQEEVKAFSLNDFQRMFTRSGFEISHYFGDYALSEFDIEKSDRLIFICKKIDA